MLRLIYAQLDTTLVDSHAFVAQWTQIVTIYACYCRLAAFLRGKLGADLYRKQQSSAVTIQSTG